MNGSKAQYSIILEAQNKTSAAFSQVQSNLKSLEPTFKQMALVGSAAFAGIAYGIKSMAESAAEVRELEGSFSRMAENIGLDSDVLLGKLQDFSKGTIANKDLILSANRAMTLGVAKNTDDFKNLLEIARLKAKDMGLTTTQAFNDIVTGIGRGSPLILDNLGIVVKAEEVQQKYAASLGVTAEQLTEEQKAQALANIVIAEGMKQVKEAGEIQVSAAERMAQLRVQIENTRDEIGKAFLPAIEKLVVAVQPIIEKFSKWAQDNPELVAQLGLAALAIAGVTATLGFVGLAFLSASAGVTALGTAMTFLAANPIVLLLGVFALIAATLKDQIAALYGVEVTWKDVWSQITGWVKTAVDAIADAMLWIMEKITSSIDYISSKIQAALDMINRLRAAASSVGSYVSGAVSSVGSFVGGAFTRAYASGGIVNAPLGAAVPAIVHGGEQIIPANRVGGFEGSITVNINGGMFMNEEGARVVGDYLVKTLQTQFRF